MQEALFQSDSYQESLRQTASPAERYQLHYETLNLSDDQRLIPARWVRALWTETMEATSWYRTEMTNGFKDFNFNDGRLSRFNNGRDYWNWDLRALADDYRQILDNNPNLLHDSMVRAEISASLHYSSRSFLNIIHRYNFHAKKIVQT